MRTAQFDEAWLTERGRAMRAEMDAAPQDEASQDAIVQRHLHAAMKERGVSSTDHESWGELLSGLERATQRPEDQR